MNELDTTANNTTAESAPAAPASAPSTSSASTSTPEPTSAPASGSDRPDLPGVPGPRPNGRQAQAKASTSLTPPNTETSKPTEAAAQPPGLTLEEVQKSLNIKDANDLKRFQGREQLFGKQTNELGQLRKQMDQIRQQEQARKAQADAAGQKIWSKTHPNHAKWQSLHGKVQDNNSRVAKLADMAKSLPPEVAQQWVEAQTAAIRGELAPEDTQQWNDFVDYRKSEDMRWHTDREGVLSEHFERMFEQRMQRHQEEQQAKLDVQQDMQDPAIQKFMEAPENKEQFDTALTEMQRDPWSYATHLVKMTQQNHALHERLKSLEAQKGNVEQRLQQTEIQSRADAKKSQAAITRDVRPPTGNA